MLSLISPLSHNVASSHCEVRSLDQLLYVLRHDVTSCRYARRPDDGTRALLDSIVQREHFERCVTPTLAMVESLVPLLTLGFSQSHARALLERDIISLARCFLGLTTGSRCKVRLEVVTRDACRRFHHDLNTLRMLCTYSGPGTLWVAREHVNVDALFELGGDIEIANQRIVPESSQVQQAGAWDVVLLKGARFSEPEGIGAVHRSPPAGTLGKTRLVLTIDAGEDSACMERAS